MMRFFIITDFENCPLLINWFWKLLNHFRYTIKTLLAWATTLIKICYAHTLKTVYWGSGGPKIGVETSPFQPWIFLYFRNWFFLRNKNEWMKRENDWLTGCVYFLSITKLSWNIHFLPLPYLTSLTWLLIKERLNECCYCGVPPPLLIREIRICQKFRQNERPSALVCQNVNKLERLFSYFLVSYIFARFLSKTCWDTM